MTITYADFLPDRKHDLEYHISNIIGHTLVGLLTYLQSGDRASLDESDSTALRRLSHAYLDDVMTCPPRTGPGVMLVLGLKERGVKMARRKHTAEQIINKLREAEVAISAGSTVAEVSRQIGVTQQTFYRWRTEYGGLKIDQARRLKQLETENGRLRRAVADLTLDNQILREAAEGNF